MAHPITQSNRVFVYGSLNRGQSNHHWLHRASFVGRARLHGGELYSLGSYPMAILRQGSSGVIHGEVFEVDAEGLDQLDILEGCPGYYDRQLLSLSDGSEGWVFLGNEELVAGRSQVEFGDWASTPVFSYGSNINPDQLRRRCKDWDGSGVVTRLDGWHWGINKLADAGDCQGFAGIIRDLGAHCWGVVHHLSQRDRRILDLREGVAIDHYRHQRIKVSTKNGERFEALTYVPGPAYLAEGLEASSDYGRHILDGADYWGLDCTWANSLRASLLITA